MPSYAILSHTWGPDEVSFRDIQHYHRQWQEQKAPAEWARLPQKKAGFSKIQRCAAQALKDGLEYIWVDTCCIDKSSSAELSEAINSMFRWYKSASVVLCLPLRCP